jgi:hypothetical protein
MLADEQLQEPATHPTLTRMRIISDIIPHWPIDLQFRQPGTVPYSPYAPFQAQPALPPIRLTDVLVAIHQAMHRRITQTDWENLGKPQQRAITKAYLARCGMSGHERAQGVKRVDFLLGRTRVLGLVRGGMDDGWDVMKLILADR